jgi:pimeloyl-ACP methyl ester carboxylesterase
VLLSGLGTPAPALDFAPLIRELGDFNVIVVEGFGYGYSDTVAPPRTIENITTELHTALGKLGITQPYVLMGHSIAGLYTLYYANHYRSEVSAVVGLDASLPGQINGIAGGGDPVERVAASIGVLRLAIAINPTIFDPDGDAYSAAEHEQMRLMQKWNFGNAAVVDEGVQSTHNFAVVDGMSYPRDLPVLSFIKKDGNQAGWRELHRAQLQDLDRGELIELDGGHYLHWTQSKAIAQKVTEFLAGTVTK